VLVHRHDLVPPWVTVQFGLHTIQIGKLRPRGERSMVGSRAYSRHLVSLELGHLSERSLTLTSSFQ
jgi:hypothetical protein